MVSAGLEQNLARAYSEYYLGRCPWFVGTAQVTRFFERSVVTDNEETLPLAEYLKSEFYQDWGRVAEVAHGLGVSIHSENDLRTFISVNRGLERDRFTEADRLFLQVLSPHVSRAVDLCRLLDRTGRQYGLYTDAEGPPALLVTPGLRVLQANPAAERLLQERDGLRVSGYQLTAMDHDDVDELRRAVAGATSMNVIHDARWMCSVRRGRGRPNFVVRAYRVPPESYLPGFGSRAILVVSESRIDDRLPVRLIERVLRLSHAEAVLAASLWETTSLTESAESLGISINTAKTQLRSIFNRTATNNQAALIKLLATTVARS